MNSKLSSLSFFSGCMGLDLGLEIAGIKHLLFCENDPTCIKTISNNRPKIPIIDDILKYNSKEIRSIAGLKQNESPDLIVGGPPCQAFSTAGKRKSFKDPRGNVFLYFVKTILELTPKYFVIENVRGLLSAALKHRPLNQRGAEHPQLTEEEIPGGALNYILNQLKTGGYDISFNLYNSANYGVPQIRERVIMIGSLTGGRVPYLKPTHSASGENGLKKWETFREATKGLKEKDMESIKFPDKRLKYYRLLKAGQNWRDLPNEKLKKEALGNSFHAGGGKTGFLRRLAWDKPSPTVVTHPAMPATDLCHPKINRPLSVQEYKRIQQFPDNWELAGTTIQKFKQLGNAVPLGLGQATGETIIDHIQGGNWNEELMPGFSFSRYKNTNDRSWREHFLNGLNKNASLF